MADLVSNLVAGTYDPGASGAVRLKFGAEYFNYSFGLSAVNVIQNAPSWVPRRGQYNQLTGFWMFKPNEKKCWQAVNTNGPLRYWNEDGAASGNPEDWELFVFEDAGGGKIRIKNVYGAYVNYGASKFECTANQGGAASFTPET